MDGEKKPGICDVPIDPEMVHEDVKAVHQDADPDKGAFRGTHEVWPTSGIHVNSEWFIVFMEACKAISEGCSWDKKARIVLEYDPGQKKMELRVYQESTEKPRWEEM